MACVKACGVDDVANGLGGAGADALSHAPVVCVIGASAQEDISSKKVVSSDDDVNWRWNAMVATTSIALSLIVPLCYLIIVGLLQKASLKKRVGVGEQLFCEMQMPIGDSFMCQKASGLSALAYSLPAAFVAWKWMHVQQGTSSEYLHACFSPFNGRTLENVAFMIACVYLAVGNLAMHGFCLLEGHRLDASSMTAIVCFVGAHAVQCGCILVFSPGARLTKWIFRVSLTVGVVCSLLLPDLCVLFGCPKGDHYGLAFVGIVSGALLILVISEITATFVAGVRARRCSICVRTFLRPHTAWGLASVAALGIGLYFQPGNGCSPQSWWQPHAIWHLFTAVAIQAMWMMMRKETITMYVMCTSKQQSP